MSDLEFGEFLEFELSESQMAEMKKAQQGAIWLSMFNAASSSGRFADQCAGHADDGIMYYLRRFDHKSLEDDG